MAKILILAPSGFGKSTSIGKSEELGIEGLNPQETYVISAIDKTLPFKNSNKIYKVCNALQPPKKENGNRSVTNKGEKIANIIEYIVKNRSEIKNIVFDDSNYVMQDYYMANAMKKGYEVFKQIGYFIHKIFTAMESCNNINFIMMGHYEEYRDSNHDTISYRYKTVGKMVQDYITPEGKFDIVLFGKHVYDDQTKEVKKYFVTANDGQFPAKSPYGMFSDIYIPNDLALVVKAINEYYG